MATAAQMAEISKPETKVLNAAGDQSALIGLVVVLLTLVAYSPISRNDFVSFDDPGYITANRHVRAGLSWETIKWAFASTEQANWHPLTWLSHAIDYQVFGFRPAGHHYMSVLLHAAVAVLLFLLLQSLTGFAWRSAVVAALFALHPSNVESVAWASERKNVLSMLFFLLMLMAYRRYCEHPGWKRYGLVLLLFAMGLMSKPMLVTTPFLLLLLDYWPLERQRVTSWARLVLEKLPLMLMAVASSIVTMIAQRGGGAIHHNEFPFSMRLANAVVAYARYIGKAFWPSHLAAFYPHIEHIPAWQVAGAFLLIASASAAALMQREKKYLIVGWLWFLGTLVPVIGLVQVGEQAMADRYAYLPFIGLFIVVVWGIADWAEARRVPAKYLAGVACAVLIALAIRTYAQIGYWQDTKILWTRTLAITGPNFVAEDSLGAELIGEGDLAGATTHLQKAVAINPHDAFSRLDLGVCQKRAGNVAGAIENYQAALQLSSDRNLRATAFGNLGSIYRVEHDYGQAQANYASALTLVPDYALALTGMGLIAEKNSDFMGAANYFARAAVSAPSDTEYLLLSQALAKAGRKRDSQNAFAKAQSLSLDWNATIGAVGHLLQE